MFIKKIFYDSTLSVFASILPIAVLQLLMFPTIALKLGNTQYGLMVTLVSLFYLFSLPYGNVLNNIRLLRNSEYEKSNINGDFNILLTAGLVVNTIVIILGTLYYEQTFSLLSMCLILLISGLNLIREYVIVGFRIILNYKAILINNIFLVIGYFIGFYLFLKTGYWQLIYLIGILFSLFYIIKNTNLLKESFTKTPFFKITIYKTMVLFFSTFIKASMAYADKLLLYPLLGANAVSVYYSATIIGKIISIGITPISGVFLSYLAKVESFKKKLFISILVIVTVISISGYFFVIMISKPLLNYLYPAWANESIKLIYITSASVMVEVIISVLHPIILRFNNINWQIYINIANLTIYIISILWLYKLYGLIGFCLGILTATVIKLILMIVIVFSTSK